VKGVLNLSKQAEIMEEIVRKSLHFNKEDAMVNGED